MDVKEENVYSLSKHSSKNKKINVFIEVFLFYLLIILRTLSFELIDVLFLIEVYEFLKSTEQLEKYSNNSIKKYGNFYFRFFII